MDKRVSTNTYIFSTGVFLQPIELKINGEKQWRWIATSFEDDCFSNGEIIIPKEFADEIEDLIDDSDG